MKKILLALALVLPFTLHHSSLQAQEEDTYNESVVVKGSYTPVIEQHEKLTFPTVVSDTLGQMEHKFQYSITPTRLKALYEPSRIRAARIVGEPTTKLYNNYLRVGFGNYWTPMADLYWSSLRDKKKTYGVRINHHSSWDKLPDYGPNHFGQTGITLFGKYIVGNVLQLSSDLSYEHDHNLYYGFTDSTLQAVTGKTRDDISVNDYRASYNVATWNIGVRNMELDPNKLGYAANVRVSDLWGVWGQNEFNADLNGDIHYGFNIADQYKGIAYLHIDWDHYKGCTPEGKLPLGNPDTSVAYEQKADIFKLNPYVDFIFRGLQFRTGLTIASFDYSPRAIESALYLFPDITVSKKLMKDNLVLSLAVTGGMEANSMNAMRQVNPYIAPDAVDEIATRHWDFIGHARWTLSKKLEANAEVSYSLLRDDLTFCLNPVSYTLKNVYLPLYLDDNRLTAGADITFVNDEMLILRAGGHYYLYDVVDDNSPASVTTQMPYRPNWDALLAADVNYHNKWFFHLEGQLLGSMVGAGTQLTTSGSTPALEIVTTETLPMRYGVAAEVEYRHNRALSFFLKMDNLAFQRYWYWTNYPSQRGLFIAGLTYTIPHK